MTSTLPIPAATTRQILPGLAFTVAMPQPHTHLFEVTLQVTGWATAQLDLKMPVWTPGSYLVREYAKHLQDFRATDKQGQALPWQKLSKNHWQVQVNPNQTVQIHYRIYAHELSVRTNHLDRSHGYFNPAALCLFIPGYTHQPITVTVVPPQTDWQVTTPLPAISGQANSFLAADFDTLVDSPFEIGTHPVHHFQAQGKPHQLAVWGTGNFQAETAIGDFQKIIQVEVDLFGELPYDNYLFLLHLSSQGYGGLEHKTSCSLNYSRFGFTNQEKYQRFLCLVAHEFFHLWNVKRLRPQALETFDYETENYTDALWFCEGTTSYYDPLIPLWAGIYDAQTYLKFLGESISRLQNTPGRLVQPLSESSFDTWIKLYRPDANSRNSQISYYLKGEMVSLLLDLLIRRQHQNQRSFDHVLRQMWQQFGREEIGFSSAQLQQVIADIAGQDLSEFWQRYLHGIEELPFNDYFQAFGLELSAEIKPNQPPYLGVTLKTEAGTTTIQAIDFASPAQQAGLAVGDELVAIDGFRVTADQLADRLRDYQPGAKLSLTYFHQDQLCTGIAPLAPAQPSSYQIQANPQATSEQRELLAGWLGATSQALFE